MKKILPFIILMSLLGTSIGYSEITHLIKIAYVDVEEIFEDYPGTDDVMDELTEQKTEYQAEIAEMKEEIANLELQYELNFNSLTDDERQRRESEIEYKKEALYEYIEDANTALVALKDTLTDPIYLKIISVIQEVAAEEGYSYVFKESSSAFLYLDDEYDITDEVMDRLESELYLYDRF